MHTPGPWTLFDDKQQSVVLDRIMGPIKNVGSHMTATVAMAAFGIRSNAEVAANARLIAAAPDLLAALRKLEWSAESPRYGRLCPACESLQSEGEHEPDCYLIAAIAKAEGK